MLALYTATSSAVANGPRNSSAGSPLSRDRKKTIVMTPNRTKTAYAPRSARYFPTALRPVPAYHDRVILSEAKDPHLRREPPRTEVRILRSCLPQDDSACVQHAKPN